MQSLWLAILLILAAGVIFVLLPVALTTFYDYRRRKSVICPKAGRPAEIGLHAGRAARSAVLGRLRLRVESCSLWPERRGCGEACLRSFEEPVEQSPA
jgi:hypothetical protein